MSIIRPSAVAGMFYPAEPTQLMRQLDACWAAAKLRPDLAIPKAVPKAVIVPHAGYVYSGAVAASAYDLLKPAKGRMTRVVVLGPSHRVAFRGMAISSAQSWASPLGAVPLDRAAIASVIGRIPMVGELEQAHAQEHSLEVHLPFLQRVLGAFQLVPVVVGEATPEQVAALLDALWGGPETLIVISTDLSHYLDYSSCQELDARTATAIETLDSTALSRDQACGSMPLAGLLLTAKRRGLGIVTLDLRNSGDTAGPKDKVVGYGAWAVFEPTADAIASIGPLLVELARAAIQSGLDHGAPVDAHAGDDLPALLTSAGATFVTLKKQGQLRGCIGSPQAWRPLAEDICDNAFKAAFRDPRFPPLTAPEWANVDLSVSVLTPPVAMRFSDQADLLAQLRPRIDGLIIEDKGKRALFLPSVWEQLPDKAQFLAHLKHKAGMAPNHWSPNFTASRFQALEFS
ncbi:AmmeMemoRadiSam system protein B [Magnetospirillum sulfuroxidans]|uniref:MEMO1 family protein KEC16_16330 n=1 Tax=Magnetospirillum sulfuroxidans TaxID=611300 RepID=A0ABS5IFU7_9PROT|nr:AmmeMemoRadiSam system protein B [Magnetospirillum sulfuroxidans]MBR9973292.1 AmmeMemoRadiSam system protein B [Magnetospirillum sulfuroxidans]